MTLGKRIGGGFCIILFLTLILGFMAFSGNELQAAKCPIQYPRDRVPRGWWRIPNCRTICFWEHYYTRIFFWAGMDETCPKRWIILKNLKKNLVQLKCDINKKEFPYQNTHNFIEQMGKDVNQYVEEIDPKGQICASMTCSK